LVGVGGGDFAEADVRLREVAGLAPLLLLCLLLLLLDLVDGVQLLLRLLQLVAQARHHLLVRLVGLLHLEPHQRQLLHRLLRPALVLLQHRLRAPQLRTRTLTSDYRF
jgi:hypothetical protein